jgi:8-oxo-dGTP pyrophosphatase MutT (NUDIX family)
MLDEDFIQLVVQRLAEKSTSPSDAGPIIGYARSKPEIARLMQPPAKESAVLFPLYKKNDIWHTAFMKRPDSQGVHSGQLSFPGGRLEKNETHLEAALRESAEEVGIVGHDWKVIGALSALYIPPSHFVVQPFLAVGPENPTFHFNASEVVEWIEHPVFDLLKPQIIRRKEIFVAKFNRTFDSGYFDIQGHTLWGATAIMVQEFRSLLGYHD